MKTSESATDKAALPGALATYIEAVNNRELEAFLDAFSQDAVVQDVGREIRGPLAIREWAEKEIFAVNVTMELMRVEEKQRETILTVKIGGAFDRTGLPDPLMMNHTFVLNRGRINHLTCQIAPAQ
jgi:hypothetical protein